MSDPTLSEIMERVKAVPDTAFVQPSVALALVTEIERQASEIERLREALRFYAVVKEVNAVRILLDDCGKVARAALNEKEPHADA